ncbi:quinolinate synthase [Candidatus Gottesmanbacteria bacterium RIFCSPLOWO2_01_FULL_39_12b]|uniref:Quinolinate synthase n=1 Tax=Candidatus Gottesmanbacteria bacterium RIFCSPLOWO2_01_FULL_39_12b TaxID=1798388 RepID=A0A1F6AN78_9BACT|nr:MAG: quinolinate synthase [Candidatus Gottesmanbacteria bacterium RIFCSPLOWO2_01_FULL_39_12b]
MSKLKTNNNLIKEIQYWKKKREAVILAHNYQIPEVQDIADFVGDSLELSQQAAKTDAKIIIFCGVHFMAESAAIFSPQKTVLIPDLKAGCSLAASITAQELRKWKKQYPKAVVVTYVNTSAEVKAESDYCCTSTNAVKIVNSLPSNQEILFVPDMFLGDYVAKMTGRKNMIIYPGECHVHARVRPQDITHKMDEHPKAEFLIHPECGCVSTCMHYVAAGDIPVRQLADKTHILSTGGMMKYAKSSAASEYVVATETGILYRLKKENPKKNFIPLRDDMVCQFMKMITLPKLLNSLKNLEFEVKVPKEIADRARIPIERMQQLSN